MIGRLQVEFLGPLIDRLFKILVRRKMILDPPVLLQGQDLKVDYVSPIAKAQKTTQLFTFTRLMETIGPLAQVKPEILDNLNSDETFRYLHQLLDAPVAMLNNEEDVAQIRTQRQEQQKRTEDSAEAGETASAAKDLAQAQKLQAEAG